MASVPDPVEIRHPSLPHERGEVDESTLDHWRTLGWVPVGEASDVAKRKRDKAEAQAAKDTAAAAVGPNPDSLGE